MIRRDVEYPKRQEKIDIPGEWLSPLVRAVRANLEFARDLETEIGGYGLHNISPIVPDPGPGTGNDRTHGLSAAVVEFSSLFTRLVSFDPSAAKSECDGWPKNDGSIFSRLRIWAASLPAFLTPDEVSNIFCQLDDDSFWGCDHQRDLLLALAARWKDLTKEARTAIEDRLLAGRPRRNGKSDDDYTEHAAHVVLSRISWLRQKGCQFESDLEAKTTALRAKAPEWKPEYAASAAEIDGEPKWLGWSRYHVSAPS